MRRALCAVALLALACLLLRAARVGLAGDYIDPISRIVAQDEALYSHSAIAMAREGGWLTPRFMGRYALYKPPLLIWSAAAATKILGVSRLALRLPGAIFSALALALLFLWAGELAGWQAGAAAGALLLSNHLWHTLAALCMTDGLLLACYIGAFYALFYDPWLESRISLFGLSAAVAGAIFRWEFWVCFGWLSAVRNARLSCASVWPLRCRSLSPPRGSSTNSLSTRDGFGPSTSPWRFSVSAPARRPKPHKRIKRCST
jgi:4-amino-4-deoxy-L-arabinose transferase-like glycosyltransferase